MAGHRIHYRPSTKPYTYKPSSILLFTLIISLYIIFSLLRDNLAKGWIPGFDFLL